MTRLLLVPILFAACAAPPPAANAPAAPTAVSSLGAFSVSLTVKDLAASRDFYAKLGFEPGHGDGKRWLVMRNGSVAIGLFQGMFERNMLTFNPGWGANATPISDFVDVRALQGELQQKGLTPAPTAEAGSGPAYFMLVDPDGNPVLVDQHVDAPKR